MLERSDSAFSSSALRSGSLATTSPDRASDAVRLEPAGGAAHLEVVAEGAAPVSGELNRGAVIYRGAFPDTDVVHAAHGSRFEELRVLRSPKAPATARYRLKSAGKLRASRGTIEVVDGQGNVQLRSLPALAIDAAGRRRALDVQLDTSGSEPVMIAKLDPAGLTYPITVDPTWVSGGPGAWPSEALVALNSIWLKEHSAVTSTVNGAVAVVDASPGPVLADDAEAVVGQNVTVHGTVSANRVRIKVGAAVAGDVRSNTLVNNGSVTGATQSPLALPLPITVPAFPSFVGGSAAVTLAQHEDHVLAAGSYAQVSLSAGSVADPTVLRLSGGIYAFAGLDVGAKSRVECAAPCEIRIKNRLEPGEDSFVGPAPGSGLGPSDVVLYVEGINGSTGNLGGSPKAAVFGFDNTVEARVFVPNGTLWLKAGTSATGTFVAKDLSVGEGVSLTKDATGTCGPTDDGNPCTADSCDTATGTVHHDPVPAGTACDDATVCNGHESCDGAGTCQAGTPVAIDDGNQCTADSCDPQTGAQHAPLTGTACNDGDACTQTDTCQAGACTGESPVTCAPLDQCHDAGACNPATGACTQPAKADGASCNDGDACTQSDACQAGACTGASPVTCAPLDQCHDAGTCNPATGVCTQPAKLDGASCDDANPCTAGEACTAGACGGGAPASVDDGNPCTADACTPSGGITHTPVAAGTACADADLCNGDELCNASGTCQPGTPVATSDGNACTLDSCDPLTGNVTHLPAPAGTLCSADACTIGALCDASGVCIGGTPVLVDDGDPCTVDTCDPITGPVHSECPKLDPTVATSVAGSTAWLYTGASPVQTSVVPGAIDAERASVLFGRVRDRAGAPVSGVTVEVLGHPELGATSTDVTGRFYLVVNGGGRVVVDYRKPGFLSAQRGVTASWQEYVPVPDVVLVVPAPPMTSPAGAAAALALGAPAAQALVGPTETDQDGARRSVLIAPAGLGATINGVPAPASLTVRATEYSVGSGGPEAMPAELPPNSAYTYAVELAADEAAGARVDFDQPIAVYVDSFLSGFAPGMTVPVGSYDRGRGNWIAEDSGLVVKIASEAGGMAVLDTGGVPLTVSNEERALLAELYDPPKLLWRFTTKHFSTWDCNWPFGPPLGAAPPPGPDPEPDDPLDDPCEKPGSIIECQNQILGERIPIAGTPFSLHYRSDRTPGRAAARRLVVPIHQGTLPPDLERVEVVMTVAGKEYSAVISKANALAQQSISLDWDGTNLFGQRVQGRQLATVDVGYVYKGAYGTAARFGMNASGLITGSRTRQEVTLHRKWRGEIGTPWDARALGFGGWSVSAHHAYDPQAKTAFLGDGTRSELGTAAVTAVPATTLNPLYSFAVGPDGSYYLGTFAAVWRITRSGSATRVAGTGNWGFGGDGGPAPSALLGMYVGDVAVAEDGALYIADLDNGRIRAVRNGVITTIAGGGSSTADGAPALQALIQPRSLALGNDGAVYFAEPNANQVRKVGPDGLVFRVAGTGSLTGAFGEGGPALSATVSQPSRVAVAPDGTLYVAHRFDNTHHVVRSVGADGMIRTVAGKTTGPAPSSDGIPATQELFRNLLTGLAIGRDGSLYVAQYDDGFAGTVNLIRRVDPSGIITTVAGDRSEQSTLAGEGPATRLNIYPPVGLREGPSGVVYFASGNSVRKIGRGAARGASPGEVVLASPDGQAMHVFDAPGRHLRTDSAESGATLLAFQYGTDGRLTGVTDGNGNVTQVVRDSSGNASAIVGPYGHVTTLAMAADGYLASVTGPANETYSLAYWGGALSGLLKTFTDPRGSTASMSYDSIGRLTLDADPAGGSKSLGRLELLAGWEVSHTTGLGRTTTYRTERPAAGGQLRTQTFPDGTIATLLRGNEDGVDTITLPDGTVMKASQALDPRFGVQAPAVSRTTRTPGGLIRTESRERTTSPSAPATPYAVTAVTDSVTVNGRTTTTVFDKPTLTTTVTSPAGRISKTFHDSQMRATRREIAGITPIDFTYDSRGRLAAVAQGSRLRTTGYFNTSDSRNGYVQSVTDALSQTTAFTPDAAGRILQQLDPDSALTSFAWDGNGNLTSVTPPGQPAHAQGFTPVDLLSAYTPPVVPGVPTPATLFAYNVDRQLTQTTRPDGLLVGRTYDSAGKLDLITTPTGNVDFDYFGLTPCPTCAPGRLQRITDPSGVVLEHAYDGPLLKSLMWSGAVAGSVTFGHDPSFRVTSETVTVGATASPVAFGYDNDDILICASPSTCSPAGTDALKLTLNAGNGLVTGSTHGLVTDTLTYNAFGELASYAGKVGATGVFSEVVDTASNPRDALGRIVQRVETNGGAAVTWRYTYDLRGRLTDVLKDGSAWEQYAYDANGNRTLLTTPSGTTAGVYDAQDRLLSYGATTYTYTANGELRTKSDGAGTTTYTYDVRGNLVRVDLPGGDVIEYLVDGQDRRVGKKKNGVLVKAWLYRNQLNPVAELDGAGNLVSRFVYGSRSNVPEYLVRGGVTYRILADHLGSPRAVVDVASGAVAWRADFDAWGNRTLIAGAADWIPFGFAGGMFDHGTGLTRFGARDYDPTVGRWTAKDPAFLLFGGGSSFGGGNAFVYGTNDPVNTTDRGGAQVTPQCSVKIKQHCQEGCINACGGLGSGICTSLCVNYAESWETMFPGSFCKGDREICYAECTNAYSWGWLTFDQYVACVLECNAKTPPGTSH